MRKLTTILLTVTVLLGTAAAAEASTVYFYGAVGGKTVKPRNLSLSADGTLEVSKVSWKQWGGTTAMGSGTAESHGCTPSCAAGKPRYQKVTVKLTDRETCKGTVYYNRVAISTPSGRSLFTQDLRLDKWAPCKEG